MMSYAFTIWIHWSTWAACCWIHLCNLAAAALGGTGDACGVQEESSNSCPLTVRYGDDQIASPRIPCYPMHSSDWMVDAFTWIF